MAINNAPKRIATPEQSAAMTQLRVMRRKTIVETQRNGTGSQRHSAVLDGMRITIQSQIATAAVPANSLDKENCNRCIRALYKK
jgi:hypothetical protein